MTKTTHYKGHQWTTEEIKVVMKMWADGLSLNAIADACGSKTHAISKLVVRLRQNGIPLERRKKGHLTGNSNKPWTQGQVEYLVRMRENKATNEEIAMALGRTWSAINAMIMILRREGVPVAMRGHGVRRLWDADSLKAVAIQQPGMEAIEVDFDNEISKSPKAS